MNSKLPKQNSLLVNVTAKGSVDTQHLAIRVASHFAVFEVDEGWNVTHIPTGRAVWKISCCALGAIAFAEAISPLIDFSQSDPEALQTEARKVGLPKVFQDFRCPVCKSAATRGSGASA